ncbi:hypothetical protein [Flavobacterium sp.]|uniref:hypothetical protein n=1 Tax=Flavobacterium sp. TaxID=239 RepID=UPI004033492F
MANKSMTVIDISQNDIHVSGDVELTVKRLRSFDTGIRLDAYMGSKLILQISVATLLPSSKIHILHQDLSDTVAFTYDDKVFEWENNSLKISHNWLDFISKRLCTVYFNNNKLLEVNRKGLLLTLYTSKMDDKLALYVTLFLIARYCELDGND